MDVVRVLAWEVLLLEVIKELNQDLDTLRKSVFEGGQMPLQRRVPKFGFKNINRVEYKAINLDTIQKLAEAKNLQTVGISDFIAAGFISASQLVKVLGNGTLTAKLDVQAHAFSKTAVAAIEAAGGQVVKL